MPLNRHINRHISTLEFDALMEQLAAEVNETGVPDEDCELMDRLIEATRTHSPITIPDKYLPHAVAHLAFLTGIFMAQHADYASLLQVNLDVWENSLKDVKDEGSPDVEK